MSSFQSAEQYILSLVNIPRKEYMKDPRLCGWYLLRLQNFLDLLGNPEKKISHYIHVTGTSGKGSVCAYFHSILQASGKRVGSITSPHPTYITERFQVDNYFMSDNEFAALVKAIKPIMDKYISTTKYDMISYGELMTAMGLLYLAKKKVEWAVVEAGCGGRYDATNIIPRKDVAVINTIGLDHVETLGKTRPKIAYEKAGIIKKGARVFTQEQGGRVLAVIKEEALKVGAKLHEVDYKYESVRVSYDGTDFEYDGEKHHLRGPGEHQVKNAILAINACKTIGIKEKYIKKGLARAIQPLRFEVISKNPRVILDDGHNPDKVRTTVATLRAVNKGEKPIHIVVGLSENKDIDTILRQLAELRPVSMTVTHNTINPFRRVADPAQVAGLIKKNSPQTKVEIVLDPWEAFLSAKRRAGRRGMVLVTGSIFVAGEIRGRLYNLI